jgi:hypothetical protein
MTDPARVDEIAEIIRRLSPSMKSWIVGARERYGQWTTYPPSNTCKALRSRLLWEYSGRLTALGLEVRATLLSGATHAD